MFGFMKKYSDRDDKDRKKREKSRKEKKGVKQPLTMEELRRLEEAKRGLFDDGRGGGGAVGPGYQHEGMAVAYREPTPQMPTRESSHSLSGDGDTDKRGTNGNSNYTSYKHVELAKPRKSMSRPKRGILKGRSHYGPAIPNQGVVGNLDDNQTLEQNTLVNELTSGEMPKNSASPQSDDVDSSIETESLQNVRSAIASFEETNKQQRQITPKKQPVNNAARYRYQTPRPPPPAPPTHTSTLQITPQQTEKTFEGADLQLPQVEPPRCPSPREVILKRLTSGDFGFTLRRGAVLERSLIENGTSPVAQDKNIAERSRTVVFAEPGSKRELIGGLLLPGDRLLAVNDTDVESSSREEIIELVKKSGEHVKLRVQPIPELSELRARSDEAGTLKRQKTQARTDRQIASDKEWLSTDRVWLVHKGGFSSGHMTAGKHASDVQGKVKVTIDFNEKELVVDEDDVEKANPPQFDRVEDISSLRYLNESGGLHTLRQRYGSNLIHTYAGPTMLIINPMHSLSIYTEKVMQMFKGCKTEDMPPHIYSITQTAYRTMLSTRQDQSIVLLGRSGAGKSTNVKHSLHYLCATAGCVGNILNVEKLSAVFTLLEAFGNSRTLMNTTATRFTQLFTLDFDPTGQIAAASVQVLMLEKARVVNRPKGDPSFHVFYQMLAGLNQKQRNSLLLQNMTEPNLFMTPLQRGSRSSWTEDREKAAKCWHNIEQAFSVLGVKESELAPICMVLAAIYHLGVAGATKGTGTRYQFAHPSAAQKAAQVLGTTLEDMTRVIFSTDTTPYRSAYRSPLSAQNKTKEQESVSGIESLEGFVIGLYTEVFNVVIALINKSLSSNYRTLASIVLLDMPGFQNPASCGRQTGATLQDLCHNYMHERLQHLLHDKVFTTTQEIYSQEGIDCEFEMLPVSPGAMVNLIDLPPQQNIIRSDVQDSDQRGLLWMLDEETLFPGATDESFVERLLMHHGTENDRHSSLIQRTEGLGIQLQHFQGTAPVKYNCEGWLKTSRENPTSKCVISFLQDSNCVEISNLFSTYRSVTSTISGSVVGVEGSSSLRRTASLRRSYTTGAASLKRKSLCLQYKFQVDSLIETLRRTRIHFVHCLLPQNFAGLCDLKGGQRSSQKSSDDDVVLNVPLLRSQLRGHQLIEAVRIYRQGYPEHMLYGDFYGRYCVLTDVSTSQTITDEKQKISKLLEELEIDKKVFKLGSSQVFFRPGIIANLDERRDERSGAIIIKLQAAGRAYLARRKLKQLKLQHLAVNCIQRNVSKYLQIRDWPWWRLYTKIRPLLNVQRTDEQLRDQELELEQLRTKLERLEKEKNEYKSVADRLDTKLSEMTADLAEEATTTTQASELLESETSARIRCEKELHELQTRYQSLEHDHEKVELDLVHTQMLLVQQEDEDDEDGDSMYRQKYERLKKELEYTKKSLQQEHADELQMQKNIKKQIDKKLSDTLIEYDEQIRQVSNLKKKCHRLATESEDLQLHLQEETSRNTQLEKRQRKFDTELQKVAEQLKEEKQLRERFQRERDEAGAEKYQLDQDHKSLQVDFDLQQERMKRLESDLQEMSNTDGKDDKQVITLKRQKTDLEMRLTDQEEELDEQASTIQQLEQVKLRLEMASEKLRQQHSAETEERESEMEALKSTMQKRVRSLEAQIEEDYSDKQKIMKEKRELERQIQELHDQQQERDRNVERRLRRDLKRTKALLQDCQQQLEHQMASSNKTAVKQLKNQLEDVEYARSAAVKVRKNLEAENSDLQQQVDDSLRAKQELEERLSGIQKEKNDLQSKMEEDEEDLLDMTKKYNAAVKQQSVDQITIQSQSTTIEELQNESQSVREEVIRLQSQVDYQSTTTIDKESHIRLQAKIRELEANLELAKTTKHQAEVKVNRLRDQLDQLGSEREKSSSHESEMSERNKQLQRQIREMKEEMEDSQRKEADALNKKKDAENQFSTLETEHQQCQADLRLAFKRIADLQNVIEDDLEDDDDDDDDDLESDDDLHDGVHSGDDSSDYLDSDYTHSDDLSGEENEVSSTKANGDGGR